jgi:hypothetical protein
MGLWVETKQVEKAHPIPGREGDKSLNLLRSLLLITYMQATYFHALARSLAHREAHIYPVVNNLRTLSIATGGGAPLAPYLLDWRGYDSRAARSEAL